MKFKLCLGVILCRWSLPVRGAWVEIRILSPHMPADASLPVRGAWVEISCVSCASNAPSAVAPRAGSVG